MNFKTPSFITVLSVFLVLGPYLLPLIFELSVIFDKNVSDIPSFINIIGGFALMFVANISVVFLWWWSALFDTAHKGWQITILPTTTAAILYWSVMFVVCEKRKVVFKSRSVWFVSNVLICACISGIVFYIVSYIFGLGFSSIAVPSDFYKYGITVTGNNTKYVSTLGGLLGLIVAFLSEQEV